MECHQVKYELPVSKENHERIVTVYDWRQKKKKMSFSTENWFEPTNKYKYLELMCTMTSKDVTTLKKVHGVLKETGICPYRQEWLEHATL